MVTTINGNSIDLIKNVKHNNVYIIGCMNGDEQQDK